MTLANESIGANTSAKPPSPHKPLPVPNADFYQFVDILPPDEVAVVKQVRALHGNAASFRSSLKHWVEDSVSLRAVASAQTTRHRRRWVGGLWMQRRKPAIGGSGGNGDGALRCLDRDILRCPQRPGDDVDLFWRLGGTKAEVASDHGAFREDRLLRIGPKPLVGSGASGGLTTTAKRDGDILDSQRRKEVDRQFAVVRCLDHLGARRCRQSSQGLHHREQVDARIQRRKDS